MILFNLVLAMAANAAGQVDRSDCKGPYSALPPHCESKNVEVRKPGELYTGEKLPCLFRFAPTSGGGMDETRILLMPNMHRELFKSQGPVQCKADAGKKVQFNLSTAKFRCEKANCRVENVGSLNVGSITVTCGTVSVACESP